MNSNPKDKVDKNKNEIIKVNFNKDRNFARNITHKLTSSTKELNQTDFEETINENAYTKNRNKRKNLNKNKIVSINEVISQKQELEQIKINLAIFPFHHLISAKLFQTDNIPAFTKESSYSDRLKYYWQALAEKGFSPKEAVLFDNNIRYSFLVNSNHYGLGELSWEVDHLDILEGCSEIYLAELFTIKRLIYETKGNVPSSIEFSEETLLPYSGKNFIKKLGGESFKQLYFDSLRSSYDLTLSFQELPESKTKNLKSHNILKLPSSTQIKYQTHFSTNSRRIYRIKWFKEVNENTKIYDFNFLENKAIEVDTNPIEITEVKSSTTNYRFDLAEYWSEWQRLAQKAVFDFELLEKLEDPSAIRFYEITKLWRAFMMNEDDSTFPNKMEISYLDFAALMPLPIYNHEYQIKAQIRTIIKPLKDCEYFSFFSIKSNLLHNGNQHFIILFSFF